MKLYSYGSLALLALLVQSGLTAPAPNNCNDLCSNNNQQQQIQQQQQQVGSSRITSSYQSSYNSQQQQHMSSSGAVNGGSARLETFDEGANANGVEQQPAVQIGTQDRPGNWQDEKHFITDDGKGEMNYKAGQTVSDNGYTKFVQHSYRYSSAGGSAAGGQQQQQQQQQGVNTQVLGLDEFNREMERIRESIKSEFSQISLFKNLDEFMNNVGSVKGQLQNICDTTNVGSAVHQEAVRMMRQIEQTINQQQQRMRRSARIAA